jgi:hypothetical protein
MSDLQDLSLFLYIFLVTKIYDSNSSKKRKTLFKDFLKSFFFDEGKIVKVCSITKVSKKQKTEKEKFVYYQNYQRSKRQRRRNVKVCEEVITKTIKMKKILLKLSKKQKTEKEK